jgi:hypothetical protein
LLFMETKWASLISYGLTVRVLKDFLPLDETLNATTIHNHTLVPCLASSLAVYSG